MKKNDFVFTIISLVAALSSFVVTNIVYVPLVIAGLYLLFYFVLVRRSLNRYFAKVERIHCCYHFINSFLISLSVNDSFDEAYMNGLRLTPPSLNEETNEIENKNIVERINFLRQYFNLAIYKMFLNIVALYQEQGGNILIISDSLLRECTRVEKNLQESNSINNKHVVEFSVLWLLSLFILVFLRFALTQFYTLMIDLPMFVVFIIGYYLLFLGSAYLFVLRYTHLVIKEDVENE